jgi:hypothetical protein
MLDAAAGSADEHTQVKIFMDLSMIGVGVVADRKPRLAGDGHIAPDQYRSSDHECAHRVVAELECGQAEEASQPGKSVDNGFS